MTYSLQQLRQLHPRLFYRRCELDYDGGSLAFRFEFETEPGIRFSPEVVFMGVASSTISSLPAEVLNNLAFHLGLMEIPSYWKATCSPEIVVQAGSLDEYQLSWWERLLLNGQGEFFFQNQIDFTAPDFVTLISDPTGAREAELYTGSLDEDRLLVPVGGGKDSAVTLEMLGRIGKRATPWALNPTPAVLGVIEASGAPEPILARRTIDPALLRLNEAGYLNGHTPFSAYLAFLSVASAVLYDYRAIAVSNERSSNEGNVEFLGREINHQYSKSFEFEATFRGYSARYLASEVEYFSFLRPLYELQIARLFSRLPQYFPVFRSCNRGQKTNSWCLACPKCLFAFTILYPFVDGDGLRSILAEDLFEKPGLIEIALSLMGRDGLKPFECVGSHEETMAAFHLCLDKARRQNEALPPVLRAVQEKVLAEERRMDHRAAAVLRGWNEQNAVPPDLQLLLRRELDR